MKLCSAIAILPVRLFYTRDVCGSSHHPLEGLGLLLPRLVELRLGPGSTLTSFRDLGTSLSESKHPSKSHH
jgi:hypothetical protein